jgi:HD-GYP domain-containing protein (c-di-GMP phosphodiesterase class II)
MQPTDEPIDQSAQVDVSESSILIDVQEQEAAPDFSPRLYGIAILLVVLIVSGFALVQRFTAMDMARDMQTWQEKLNLIAESRSAAVNGWVADHFKELRVLSTNPSLQLYMTELDGAKRSASEPLPQQAYLRNLLVFTAERSGFVAPVNAGAGIGANVREESRSGLALINKQGQVVVSTLMLDVTKEALVQVAQNMEPGKEKLLDLQKDKDGILYMGFAVPVYAIQGDRTPESQIGVVIGVKEVSDNLFSLLKHPGVTEKTLETVLVREEDGKVEYLSPLQDGTSALTKVLEDKNVKTNNEYLLWKAPGTFASGNKDYRNKEVLATSRAIVGTSWVLVVKADKDEALFDSNQRRAGVVMIGMLIIAVVSLVIFAVWRYLHSQRAMMMSHHFRRMAARSMAQENLLRLVSDNQPEAIYIVDRDQVCRFANRRAADEAKMSVEAMPGKTLADVRGAARAESITKGCQSALMEHQVEYDLQRFEENGAERVIRSAYIPIENLSISALPDNSAGVLVVEQNITEVVHEREQRIHTQVQLVKTLLNLVDKRDPFAANHSVLVSELARSTAVAMELDAGLVEAAHVAGSLMNIGKIIVPTELLTKAASLSQEEKRIIHDSMNMAADLIADIKFEGPVAPTLRQWQEKWDGTGPLGLTGEQSLVSARIIAVANAFIGMISPRSWRTAISVDEANKFLMENSDKFFDRRVVVALMHYLDTHVGRAWLKQVLESKKVA